MDAAGLRLRPEYLLFGLQRHPGCSMQPFFKIFQYLVPYHYSGKTGSAALSLTSEKVRLLGYVFTIRKFKLRICYKNWRFIGRF